jgi:hypothetical protein
MRWAATSSIECKNLAEHSPAYTLHSFASKAAVTQVKLAFFVSFGGFTEPARAVREQQTAA